MQQRVNPGNKSLADYRSIVRRELYDEVVALGERLRGKRVLHVSATSFGGGVAEILSYAGYVVLLRIVFSGMVRGVRAS